MDDIESVKSELAELKEAFADNDTGNAIPYERFRQLNAKIKEVAKAVASLETAQTERLSKLEADLQASAEALQAVTGERDTLAGERDAWSTEKQIVAGGISDPEGIEFARLAWSRIPEEKRPEDMTTWLQDRDALPAAVRAYLPQEAAPASQGAPTQQGQGHPRPMPYDHAPSTREIPHDPNDYAAQRPGIWNGSPPVYPWTRKDS